MGTTTKQQNKVPELRFPEFTGKWEVRKIDDIFKVTRGKVLAVPEMRQSQDETYKYPVYSSQTKRGGLVGYYDKFLFSDALTWTTDGANAGDVNFRKGKFYCTNVCGVLLNKQGYSNETVATALGKVSPRFVSHVGNPKLMNNVVAEISVVLPVLPEQQKIADFLGSVDAWLDNLRQQKTALETYKRGMMQKLFTQQVRFKDDDGKSYSEWEEKKLGDVSVKSNTGVSAGSLENNDGEYAVYGASGLYKHVDFYQEEEPYIAIIKDGSGVGRTAIYPGKSSVIGTLNVIKPIEGMNTYFLYMLVSRLNLLKYVIGGAIPHIYYKDYKREKVMIPVLAEQKKIADFLTSIDKSIESKQQQIAKAEEWKKGLMQKMFV